MSNLLLGLVAAAHTPFDRQGGLNLAAVESQAKHLAKHKIDKVFIAGSTGESHSLSLDERVALTKRWLDIAPDHDLQVIVHVGSNCLRDSQTLASQAQSLGAMAISSLAPSYFKPKSVEVLVDCCALVAQAAPNLPYYFYDIPALTGVVFSMPQFLVVGGGRIPNLAGIKFTNSDMMSYQNCLKTRFDIPWGIDEHMLGALALGAQGAVGSSFNFAAPIYQRLMVAFENGDMQSARKEQMRSVKLIELLASFGYMAAAKATMGLLGVDVGTPRLPNGSLTPVQIDELGKGLSEIGFFEWGVA